MNINSVSSSSSLFALFQQPEVNGDTVSQKDKVVLKQGSFRIRHDGKGILKKKSDVEANKACWKAALKTFGISPQMNGRARSYLARGKDLTMRRLHLVLNKVKLKENGGKTEKYYAPEEIMSGVKSRLDHCSGQNDAGGLRTYRHLIGNDPANDGIYAKELSGNKVFAMVHRVEDGVGMPGALSRRSEKVHISVHPDDIERAYQAIAPILTEPNGRLGAWKVVNVDEAKVRIMDMMLQQAETTDGTLKTELEDQQTRLKRVYESAQFTLYPMAGQGAEEFAEIVRLIDNALLNEGVRVVKTPESDEPIYGTVYASFRIESLRLNPGDEGYDDAALKQGIKDGSTVCVDMDPYMPGYDIFKATFRDNEFYRELSK